MKKRRIDSKVLYFIFLGIVFIEVIAAVIGLILANDPDVVDNNLSTIFLGILASVLFTLPFSIEKRVNVDIPNYLKVTVLIFLFASLVLGNIHDFLVNVPHYDKLLHVVSGVLISIIGFEIINIYSKTKLVGLKLTPGLVSVFAFTFSLSLLLLWEIYEFAIDVLAYNFNSSSFGNMQRYLWGDDKKGALAPFFPQDYGLFDTMLDLIVGAVGAAVVSLIGYKRLLLVKKEEEKLNESLKLE